MLRNSLQTERHPQKKVRFQSPSLLELIPDVELDAAIRVQPWGERSFYATDPWGNRICFVQEGTCFTGRATS